MLIKTTGRIKLECKERLWVFRETNLKMHYEEVLCHSFVDGRKWNVLRCMMYVNGIYIVYLIYNWSIKVS